MNTIFSRQPQTTAITIPAAHQLGDLVTFEPFNYMPFGQQPCSWEMIICQVVGINFRQGKVLYDLALCAGTDPTDGSYVFNEVFPICDVDSYLVNGYSQP